MVALSRLPGVRVFRNNVGMAWAGQVQRMRDGSVLIKNARPLHAGLCAGSSDLIGWTVVEITPDMVGRKIAVFTAVETKTATGKATTEQLHFINTVRAAGGFSGVARNEQEATGIIQYFTRKA